MEQVAGPEDTHTSTGSREMGGNDRNLKKTLVKVAASPQ